MANTQRFVTGIWAPDLQIIYCHMKLDCSLWDSILANQGAESLGKRGAYCLIDIVGDLMSPRKLEDHP